MTRAEANALYTAALRHEQRTTARLAKATAAARRAEEEQADAQERLCRAWTAVSALAFPSTTQHPASPLGVPVVK